MVRFLAIPLLAVGLLCGLAGPIHIGPIHTGDALAADAVAYTDEAFAAAQAAGKPILIDVDASWCSTCAQQRAVLKDLEKSPDLADLTVFRVDFDQQKDVMRKFNVQERSTLIVFSGKTEQGRATAITDPTDIRALLLKAKSS